MICLKEFGEIIGSLIDNFSEVFFSLLLIMVIFKCFGISGDVNFEECKLLVGFVYF